MILSIFSHACWPSICLLQRSVYLGLLPIFWLGCLFFFILSCMSEKQSYIYPEKNLIWKDTCTPMFIAAWFTIAKTWKQPKCPLTDEWVKKMWYVYTMEYYSAIKKNEIIPFAATWMDLDIIILSKVNQTKTNTIWYHLSMESKKVIQMNLFTKQK